MSQWQNLSWPPPPQSGPLPRTTPEKPELYPYNLSSNKYIRHPYLPTDYDALAENHHYATRPAPNVNPSIPHPPEHLQVPSGAIPYSQPPVQSRPATGQPAVPDSQFGHVVPQQYPMPPGEFNNHSNYVATKQWENLELGQPGGSVPKKEWLKGESDLAPVSESSSLRNSNSSVRSGLESATLKVTKRSRMGCLTCRQRKKRCCETRPKCSECQRLRLNCQWPKPGTEHKNKPKEVKNQENMIDHDVYGRIKVLRGIVEYRSN